MAHYSASKGSVVMLSKALALELASYQIQVNAVAPGGIITPGAIVAGAAFAAKVKDPAELTEKMMSRLPLGRHGTPDDVAKVVLFLASAAADYMTGSVILVDGGRLLS